MSIVIEAWTAVFRIAAVDVRYPGGVEALEAALSRRTRTFHRDEHLAGVSFLTAADTMDTIGSTVGGSDLVAYDGTAWRDIAALDEVDGPSSCDWLQVAREPSGAMACWLVGTDPGELIGREGWTPADARTLRSFTPDEAAARLRPTISWHDSIERALEMGGVAAFIDEETGEVIYGRGE